MKVKKFLVILLIFILSILFINIKNVEAVEIPSDLKNITNEEILNIYDQITKEYSNEDIANIITQHKEQIANEAGVSESIVEAGANFIRNTDENEIRNILADESNLNKIRQSLQEGKTAGDAVASVLTKTTTSQKIELFIKVLLANKIVKAVLLVILILFIYCTITRWIIYKKAGKNGFAAIIPFYRQITMYKICDLSPFLMLLWLVPIFGWIAMFIIAIMKRILLAESFGKGGLFGLGLLILTPIFQSIIAFNKNIEYQGE